MATVLSAFSTLQRSQIYGLLAVPTRDHDPAGFVLFSKRKSKKKPQKNMAV
jgi:hypothetical protein